MRQKYRILRDDEKDELVIREFAELDKETLSFLCEERFRRADVEAAISRGGKAIVSALRTRNLYPPGLYMDGIAETVVALYSDDGSDDEGGGKRVAEVSFDDAAFLTVETDDEPEVAEDIEEEPADDLDELLEDDIDGNFDDKGAISTISSSLKIADEESLDIDDDV